LFSWITYIPVQIVSYCCNINVLSSCSDGCFLTLDPNSAHTRLILSEDNRKIIYVREKQSYPDHPERFRNNPQVLCRESLSGRCYWEAERSGTAAIVVSYKGISRKGRRDCVFGYSENTWCLISSDDTFTVRCNSKITDVCVPSGSSNRIGVYVDVPAGTLSFYSLSLTHTLTHLHTFTSTFTKSLCAGFGFLHNILDSSVCLCQIDKSSQVKSH